MGEPPATAPSEARISLIKPCLALIPSFAIQFQLGAILGQSSTMIHQLMSPDSSIQIDEEYATWLASMGVIGAPFSAILGGPLTDKLGRRTVIRMCLLLSAIGHAIVGIASSASELLIGRFVIGLAIGFASPSLVYMSEICIPSHRNFLLPATTIFSSIGLFYVYTFGMFVNWDIVSLTTSGLAILAIIYAFIIPESPAWLFQNHRLNEAIESLEWVKGKNCDLDSEIRQLKDACAEQPTETSPIWIQLNSTAVIKPFCILSILSLLQNGAGLYVLLYYSISFLKEFKLDYDPALFSVAIAVTRLIACTLASFTMKAFNRKTLGTISGFGMGAFLLALLVYLMMFEGNTDLFVKYSYFPVFCLVSYVVLCSFGVHPLPLVVIYELYPLNVRGVMCGVSFAMGYVFTFISLKTYHLVMVTVQIKGTVLLFLIFSVLFALFSLLILPETRGKTLVEIERGFKETNGKEKEKDCTVIHNRESSI